MQMLAHSRTQNDVAIGQPCLGSRGHVLAAAGRAREGNGSASWQQFCVWPIWLLSAIQLNAAAWADCHFCSGTHGNHSNHAPHLKAGIQVGEKVQPKAAAGKRPDQLVVVGAAQPVPALAHLSPTTVSELGYHLTSSFRHQGISFARTHKCSRIRFGFRYDAVVPLTTNASQVPKLHTAQETGAKSVAAAWLPAYRAIAAQAAAFHSLPGAMTAQLQASFRESGPQIADSRVETHRCDLCC